MLTLKNISFRYRGRPAWILQNFSFQANPGDIIAVKGVSGSGKSTLLHIFCGVIPKLINGYFQGDVFIGNTDLAELSLPETAPHMSLVMQNPDLQLFFPIVEQELAFAPENLKLHPYEIEKRVAGTLSELKIGHLRYKETANLSYGQKKLVTFASLLTLDPEILLLDEISAGISSTGIEIIVDILKKRADSGKIIIIADHNPLLLGLAKKTIDLDEINNGPDLHIQ